jgi:ribosomal protein L30
VAKKKKQEPGKLEITQVRSVSGRPEKQRRTLRALGLTKNQTSVVQNDTRHDQPDPAHAVRAGDRGVARQWLSFTI